MADEDEEDGERIDKSRTYVFLFSLSEVNPCNHSTGKGGCCGEGNSRCLRHGECVFIMRIFLLLSFLMGNCFACKASSGDTRRMAQ